MRGAKEKANATVLWARMQRTRALRWGGRVIAWVECGGRRRRREEVEAREEAGEEEVEEEKERRRDHITKDAEAREGGHLYRVVRCTEVCAINKAPWFSIQR